MAYVRKMITNDEQMIGIARLHWIYVIKGLIWFLALAFAGWAMNELITRGMLFFGDLTRSSAIPVTFLSVSHNIMLFMMGGGFFIFMLFVTKVLTTEVALTTRHVILKEGWIFVKVKQVDIVEILGENLDLGHLGRFLGYGYVMLDCRFIGDIRLPAIENPERFLRALHHARQPRDPLAEALDGKAEPHAQGAASGPATPQPTTPQPTPEIIPGVQPGPEVSPPNPGRPEIQPPAVPHSPPAPQPPAQPETAPPQPAQPIPPPYNPEPPLQPPTDAQQAIVVPVVAQSVKLAPEAVAQVVQQVMPQMAEQVVKKMAEEGLLHPENANDDVDTDLIESFDDARLDKDGKHALRDKVEYAIH